MAGWALELGPKEVVTITTWWLFHRPANQPVLSPPSLSLSLSLTHTHTHTHPWQTAYRTRAPHTLKLLSLTSEIRAQSGVAEESVLPFGTCLPLLHTHEPAVGATRHARHVANCPPSDTASRAAQFSPAIDAHIKFLFPRNRTVDCHTQEFLDLAVVSVLYRTRQPTVCWFTGNIWSRGHTLWKCNCIYSSHRSTAYCAPIFVKTFTNYQ